MYNKEMDAQKLVFTKLSKLTKKPFTLDSVISEIGVDSLDLVEMVTDAEDEFDIHFSDEELMELETVGDLVTKLKEKLDK